MDLGALNRFFNAHGTLIALLVVGAVLSITSLAIQSILAERRRDQMYRRSQKSASSIQPAAIPLAGSFVLSSRWLRTGEAATTTDGGCFLYIDRVTPQVEAAALTLRVDGEAVRFNESVRVGEQIVAIGKYGTYTLTLHGVDGVQAQVGIALKNRHL